MKQGDECGQSPTGTFTLASDEQITVVNLRMGSYIDAIGFVTNKGNTYGPYGGGGGGPSRLDGPVYGFYGGNFRLEGCSCLRGIGTWTEPPPTPAAPSSPSPPPVLDQRSATFGSQTALTSTWDDRTYSGTYFVIRTNVGETLKGLLQIELLLRIEMLTGRLLLVVLNPQGQCALSLYLGFLDPPL
jgi:hypothetical protein